MKRQVKKVKDMNLQGTNPQPIAFDANVEELLNHLGDLIGEILIAEIINPKIIQSEESKK